MKKREEFVNKIICGDCLEIMKKIPNKSVNLVVTDPPYGVGKDKWDKLNIPFLEKSLAEMRRVCGGTILMYVSMKYLKNFMELNPDRIMFFIKDYIQIMPTTLQWATDPILVFWGEQKPDKKPMIRDWFKVSTADTSKKPKIKHLAIKPLKAIKYLISRFSVEGNLVLDPFLGSGTTAVACKELNRNYIGIEINPEYIKIAEKRLQQQTLGI